jgi:hypothetical protein
MLGGSPPADDALTLAVMVQKLPFNVAQHWTVLAFALGCIPTTDERLRQDQAHRRLGVPCRP